MNVGCEIELFCDVYYISQSLALLVRWPTRDTLQTKNKRCKQKRSAANKRGNRCKYKKRNAANKKEERCK